MQERVHNFNPGPSLLPLPVLEKATHDIFNFKKSGMGVMEISHRSSLFADLLSSTKELLRSLLSISKDYHILFCTGGATNQFSMVPMNILPSGSIGAYAITGAWGEKAEKEAKKFGSTLRIESSNPPKYSSIKIIEPLPENTTYLHYTSNNTIYGTQWPNQPHCGAIPLVCDASSDILSRKIDVNSHGLIYFGAQKNVGTAGVTMVILRKEMYNPASPLPVMMDYETYIKKDSLYNTPPVFPIYLMHEVLQWIKSKGGISQIEQNNKAKSDLLYDTIDASDFYKGYAEPEYRSEMNVTFTLRDEGLTKKFLSGAEEKSLYGLAGHRSIGGIRASVYNALEMNSVEALVNYMIQFQKEHQ